MEVSDELDDLGSYFKDTIGEKYGRTYLIVIRPDYSSLTDAEKVEEKFKVNINIHYRENGEKHEIVRIDNADGYFHIHKFYSESDSKEEIDMDFWQALDYIQENWERFADEYEKSE